MGPVGLIGRNDKCKRWPPGVKPRPCHAPSKACPVPCSFKGMRSLFIIDDSGSPRNVGKNAHATHHGHTAAMRRIWLRA